MTELAEALSKSSITNTATLPKPTQKIEQVLIDIAEFKESAVAWARTALKNDSERSMPILEIKEVKDLTAIITQVEGTYKNQAQDSSNTTVNILVQNLVNKHSDDC